MKSYRKELRFHLPTRRGIVNITPQVEEALKESGIREGLVLVNAMNITASVFINDDESGLHHDYEVWLEKLAPEKPYEQYRHNGYEDNADAHLKRTVMGRARVGHRVFISRWTLTARDRFSCQSGWSYLALDPMTSMTWAVLTPSMVVMGL